MLTLGCTNNKANVLVYDLDLIRCDFVDGLCKYDIIHFFQTKVWNEYPARNAMKNGETCRKLHRQYYI